MKRTILGLIVVASVAGPMREATAQFDSRYFDVPPAANAPTMGQLPALAKRLDDESQQFVPAVRREVGGTPQGYQLVIRGNAMRGAAEAFSRTLQPGGDPNQRGVWYDRFVRSLDAVQAELNNPPGTAPVATAIAQRMGRLGFEISRALGPGGLPGPPPPGGGPPPPGFGPPAIDRYQLMQLVQTASAHLGAANGFLASDVGRVPPFDGAMLDIQVILVGLQQINRLGLAGPDPAQVRASFLPLWDRARQIHPLMQDRNPALARARASWDSATVALGGIARSLGIPPDLTPTPGPPPGPIPTPGFGPGHGHGRRLREATALADQLGGEADGFIAAIQPNVLRIPQGHQFVADARALRASAIAFRHAAVGGAGPDQMRGAFAQLDQAYGSLLNRVNRIAGFRSGPNIDRVRRLGGLVDQIRGTLGF